jgi:hypothetical protein
MACKQPLILDEPVPLPYQTHFGQTVNEPIHIFTTTPTEPKYRVISGLQFDHISLVSRFKYDTIEEALQNRRRVKCCERDHDSDGNCDIHRERRSRPYLGY